MTKETCSYIRCKTTKVKAVKLTQPTIQFKGLKLFTINLLDFTNLTSFLKKHLNTEEINRANKFRFSKDRNRFIICRAVLKCILSEIVTLNTNQINFAYNKNNKPFLASHSSMYFNLSHSHDYALIGIANSEIGVDIEYIDKNFVFNDILTNIFNTQEIYKVNKSVNKHLCFYKLWTRKEAYVKHIGIGVDDSIKKLNVIEGMHPVKPAFISNKTNIDIISFNVNKSYIASIALNEKQKVSNTIKLHEISPNYILNK